MLLGGVPQVLPEESVLADRYVVEARLGDGAMGTVYRARHIKFGRRFAIKVLHKSLMENPKVVQRFEREAELAGRLRHTNVASVVDVGVHDGMHFMAMEFASGETLTALLADGPMTEVRMLDIVKQLCAGLQHAHEVGLIHRDFKPDNVIVEPVAGGREVARIVDWGVAIVREAAADTEAEDRLTTKGIVVGTPHYMAPEQARGAAMDHRVDLFALGLICYELLTGVLPFEGSGVDIARANLGSPIPPMLERNPNVRIDPVLEGVVRRLLEKHPDDRPASGNGARELFELYERDRASCALMLGVELPVEDRRTGAIAELDDSEVTDLPDDVSPARAHSPSQNKNGSRDPERDRETDELQAAFARRRIAVAGLAVAAVLALLLWLWSRGSDHSGAPRIVAQIDAGTEVVVVETKPEELDHLKIVLPAPVELPVDAPHEQIVATPKVVTPKKPAAGSGSGAPTIEAPTGAEVAKLYGALGRELKTLDENKGMDATIELWPRYRWIRINEWITTPERRARIAQELERLRADIKASY
jgi:serine/threonine protein kinase